jgi:malonyl-CoA decarboxylase
VNELPAEVAPILSLESAVGDPRRARCAVFYSITSCQPGLKGISFGNFLIKQVAEDLHKELPNLKVFATLSPIPGLRTWAKDRAPSLVARADATARPADALREDLQSLAAWYLTREWEDGHVLDPVARFHLGNGARLERLNWMADATPKGIAQSFGLMVNYVYDLGDVERNHEEYVNRHRVAASSAVDSAARTAQPRIEKAAPNPTSTT